MPRKNIILHNLHNIYGDGPIFFMMYNLFNVRKNHTPNKSMKIEHCTYIDRIEI